MNDPIDFGEVIAHAQELKDELRADRPSVDSESGRVTLVVIAVVDAVNHHFRVLAERLSELESQVAALAAKGERDA